MRTNLREPYAHCIANEYRGLPLGYLNRLEQRLAETESALYGALITLASTNATTTVQATAKPDLLHKSKAARMNEWTQLPLRDWTDIYRWKISVGDQFILNQSQGSMLADSVGVSYVVSGSPTADNQSHSPQRETEARGLAGLASQPERDVHMGSPYDINRQPTEMVPSPVYSTDQALESAVATLDPLPGLSNATVAGNISATGREQADELSKSRPSIYF